MASGVLGNQSFGGQRQAVILHRCYLSVVGGGVRLVSYFGYCYVIVVLFIMVLCLAGRDWVMVWLEVVPVSAVSHVSSNTNTAIDTGIG